MKSRLNFAKLLIIICISFFGSVLLNTKAYADTSASITVSKLFGRPSSSTHNVDTLYQDFYTDNTNSNRRITQITIPGGNYQNSGIRVHNNTPPTPVSPAPKIWVTVDGVTVASLNLATSDGGQITNTASNYWIWYLKETKTLTFNAAPGSNLQLWANINKDSTNAQAKLSLTYTYTYTIEEPHVHSYSAATCTEAATCSCGATTGSALGHSYGSASCTEPAKCTRCGATTGSAMGHNWQWIKTSTEHYQRCTRCSAEQNRGYHSGDWNSSHTQRTCSTCGYLMETNTAPSTPTISPTGANLNVTNRTASFSASSTGDPSPTLKWYVDGTYVSTGGSYTYAPGITESGTHKIKVSAENVVSTVYSSEVSVNIDFTPIFSGNLTILLLFPFRE